MSESKFTCNGVLLTNAQAMTIRVAIESFAYDLITKGLGDDELGKAITDGYLARIQEIRTMMKY